MVNSIKLILSLRGMKQQDLAKNISKQQVSRWVLQKRKIPKDMEKIWEERILKVPSSFFVNKKGYCKLLNEEEEAKVRDYILEQNSSESQPEFTTDEGYEKYYRQDAIRREMRKIVREVKSDIEDTTRIAEESISAAFDCIEENQKFYKALLHLRKKHILEMDEWKSILKAIAYVGQEIDKNSNDEFACDLYEVIKKKREKQLREYEELKKLNLVD